METQEGPQAEPREEPGQQPQAQQPGQAQGQQPHPPRAPHAAYYYPPPYYPPPYYPPPYYPQPTSGMDMPLVALIVSLVGLVYWCPPFVLPGITLYLIGKARKEIAAGVPAGPSSETYLNIARVLAIIEICLAGVIILIYAAFFLIAIATS